MGRGSFRGYFNGLGFTINGRNAERSAQSARSSASQINTVTKPSVCVCVLRIALVIELSTIII